MNGDQEPWIVGDQERRTLWSRGCVSRTPVSTSVSACVCTVWTRDTIMMIVTRSHWLRPRAAASGFGLKTQSKESATPSHGHPHMPHPVVVRVFLLRMLSTWQWSRATSDVCGTVHSPVVRAADCRSAGPWFNSGWRRWIHIHWHVQRNNIMSPITTTITMPMTTIPRKSVNTTS